MAKKSMVAKTKRLQIKSQFKARVHSRCNRCGRPRGFIPGVTKSSW
jgi:ribosomal protein S14